MNLKQTTAGVGLLGALTFGAVDASVLNEKPLERIEQVAEYRIEAKQVGNKVETTFPWKDQEGLKVVYDMGEPSLDERIKDKRKKEVVTEVVDFGEGGFKIDVVLSEKPDTNRFCYQIEGYENYDFFYQPPLTEEEIAEGAERPEDIVGSYAVYHKELKDHVLGRENYATGKVMHIPRPQVWEVNNQASTTQWAELSYDEKKGELCVTASQEFLDTATYPVRIDPTFGYTTAGASSEGTGTTVEVLGTHHTAPANGAITSFSHYVREANSGASPRVQPLLADYTTGSLISQDTECGIFSGTSFAWQDRIINSGGEITSGTEYWLLSADFSAGGYNMEIRYDAGSAGKSVIRTAGSASTGTICTKDYSSYFPVSESWTSQSRIYSIYATYTETAEEETTPPQSEFWF